MGLSEFEVLANKGLFGLYALYGRLIDGRALRGRPQAAAWIS